ncbi:flagellar hook-associated 2 domain protein, partial [mine drainage metagenome]
MSITETAGTGLTALTYSSGSTNYTQQTAAQDAGFSIAGIGYTSPSNTVTNALSGVTLNLLTTTSAPATLTVADNTTTIQSNVQTFVKAYNTLQKSLTQLGGYDATTSTAGPLMGNSALTNAQSQIQAALFGVVNTGSATYTSLASLGITANSDGSLSLNMAQLAVALSTHFSAVSTLFSGKGGIASGLNTVLNAQLSGTGPIESLSQSLVQQNNALTQQSQQLSQQMSALQASLTQQYSSLNVLLSQLQTTSSYLTQAFAS